MQSLSYKEFDLHESEPVGGMNDFSFWHKDKRLHIVLVQNASVDALEGVLLGSVGYVFKSGLKTI